MSVQHDSAHHREAYRHKSPGIELHICAERVTPSDPYRFRKHWLHIHSRKTAFPAFSQSVAIGVSGDLLIKRATESFLGTDPSGTISGARNIVRGNRIGLGSAKLAESQSRGVFLIHATESSIIGNQISHGGEGIAIDDSTSNQIAGNEVSSNYFRGVAVYGGEANRITTNSIFGNGYGIAQQGFARLGLGIDLFTPAGFIDLTLVGGVNANDTGDFDSGSNKLQNYPDLFPVRLKNGVINGKLSTSLGTRTYRVELFASAVASPSGHGEGERFLGAVDVNTGISGETSFSLPIPPGITNGTFITATATDSEGNTSEFSKAVQACSGTDRDLDGICDELEAGVPNRGAGHIHAQDLRAAGLQNSPPSGDGNGDGIADSQQANVCSLIGIAGKWLTLAAPNGLTFKNVEPSGPPDFNGLPAGYSFPLGFVSFTLAGVAPGSAVTVTNILHESVELTTVMAYGPTAGDPQPHWYELNPVFAGDELRLSFTDGATGDHDLAADGAITTVYAPAYRLPPPPILTLLSYNTSLVESLEVVEVNGNAALATNQTSAVSSVLAWPAGATDWVLQFTGELSSLSVWRSVVGTPAVFDNQNVLTDTTTSAARFYQLRRERLPALRTITGPTLWGNGVRQ